MAKASASVGSLGQPDLRRARGAWPPRRAAPAACAVAARAPLARDAGSRGAGRRAPRSPQHRGATRRLRGAPSPPWPSRSPPRPRRARPGSAPATAELQVRRPRPQEVARPPPLLPQVRGLPELVAQTAPRPRPASATARGAASASSSDSCTISTRWRSAAPRPPPSRSSSAAARRPAAPGRPPPAFVGEGREQLLPVESTAACPAPSTRFRKISRTMPCRSAPTLIAGSPPRAGPARPRHPRSRS